MLMRTRNAYFGSWNSFNDLVDDKPGKWDREPHENYRISSPDCDIKRQGPCKIVQDPRPKIFRSNPFRVAYFNSHWQENDDIEIDDDNKITGPRRDQYGRVKSNPTPDDPEGDITPDIEWRLFLIRQAALIRYRTMYS